MNPTQGPRKTSQNQTRIWRVCRMKSVRRKDIATSLKRSALPKNMNLSSLGIMSRLTNHHIYNAVQVFYDGKRRPLPRNLKCPPWVPFSSQQNRKFPFDSQILAVQRTETHPSIFPSPTSYSKCPLQWTEEVS